MQLLDVRVEIAVGEAVLQFEEGLSQLDDGVGDVGVIDDHVVDQLRQLGELLGAEAPARHLGDAHPQGARGGEALLVGGGLVVADDVGGLEAPCDFGPAGVADAQDDLVRFGERDVRIAGDVQAGVFQRAGEGLGVGDDGGGVLVAEVVHLVGGHQQAQHRTEMMVGDAAGLIDGVRGVGQDAAALSGRLVAKAILASDKAGTDALGEYTRLTKRITKQTRKNQDREIDQFETNEELKKHLQKNMIKTGVGLMLHSFLNKFKSAEKQKLLPP